MAIFNSYVKLPEGIFFFTKLVIIVSYKLMVLMVLTITSPNASHVYFV